MAHHEPLKALGPIEWPDVPATDLKHFLQSTFSSAQTVVDSVPIPPNQAKPSPSGRARSHTDSSVLPNLDTSPNRNRRDHANTTAGDNEAAATSIAHATQLQKEWKEVKVPAKDNPLAISVYKLSGKDGRGAWFARRSLHEGIPFAKFQRGLEIEFGETMKDTSGGPGSANVRGIGAERRVEHMVCEEQGAQGTADIWLLSAQFGPITPRDFVTLLLTGSGEAARGSNKSRAPRQYMIVSKPCAHPDCPPRNGLIRGFYESVEIIREVPIEKPLRRTRSSVDMRREEFQLSNQQIDGQSLGKEAARRSAARNAMQSSEQSLPRSMSAVPPQETEDDSGVEMAVEWIMITRSDPGGSVPRFMVEKGTPGGIINDAGRFLRWLDTKTMQQLEDNDDSIVTDVPADDEKPPMLPPRERQTPSGLAEQHVTYANTVQDQEPPTGLYSMITGVLGAASSAVASHLPRIAYTSGQETDPDSYPDDSDSDESDRSYASAPEPEEASKRMDDKLKSRATDLTSLHSGKSEDSAVSSRAVAATTAHEKQLQKLQERYRKLEEKMARQQERSIQQGKQKEGSDDSTALTKLREKHEREIAKQEENYRKEVKKLEEKRLREEKKAEERRKKEAEKEARGNLAMELERMRVERDIALKQIDILKEQVGDLQAQNTKLVARLGAVSSVDDIAASGSNGVA